MGFAHVTNSKKLQVIYTVVLSVLAVTLSLFGYYNYKKQYDISIDTYLELESKIIKETASVSKLWFQKRIEEGASVEEIEQEILINFIEPISILQSGDAWIYNKDYVVFDKSSDFPDDYRGKSMRQIFEIQRKYGAEHYDEITYGVENGTEGRGWYIWLPEKGREWVAWTSFRFHDETWTLGLSTPENEILEYSQIKPFIIKQIISLFLVIIFLIVVAMVILNLQKRQEKLIKEINDTNAALKGIDKMKNEFITNISHDFRSPLSIIFNLAELNLTGKSELPGKIEEDFKIIYNTALKFLSKINTLIDLTKIETHGLQLKVSRVNLRDFLSASVKYYSSILKHSNIKVSLEVESESSGFCCTDIEKLDDILNNLMSNAIKFITHDHGKITVYLKETDDSVEIRVEDNGLGIKDEDIEIIFKRFEQSGNASFIPYKGSGVGLAYCRQLVELLGGSIKAVSRGEGCGAVFTVTLDKKRFGSEDVNVANDDTYFVPRCINLELNQANQQELAVSVTDENGENEYNPYKGVILIVEDESAMRNIVTRTLEAEGYRNFIAAKDGREALELMNKYRPDLIVSDFQMPQMSGDEFYNIVRREAGLSEVPFIFISAVADEQIAAAQRVRNGVAFLLKPIKSAELIAVVNTAMKNYMERMKG